MSTPKLEIDHVPRTTHSEHKTQGSDLEKRISQTSLQKPTINEVCYPKYLVSDWHISGKRSWLSWIPSWPPGGILRKGGKNCLALVFPTSLILLPQNKRVRWKIDLIILPIFLITQALQFMDKTALNYANLFGYKKALNLKGQEFNYLSASKSMLSYLLIIR